MDTFAQLIAECDKRIKRVRDVEGLSVECEFGAIPSYGYEGEDERARAKMTKLYEKGGYLVEKSGKWDTVVISWRR